MGGLHCPLHCQKTNFYIKFYDENHFRQSQRYTLGLKKGFFEWFEKEAADFVCVQELKAQEADMTADFLTPFGYHGHFHYAEKKGYSGAGVYSRTQPDAVHIGFGSPEFDAEGRYVRCDFGNLSVISVYCPSGSSSPERQEAKFRFMALFMPHLADLIAEGRELIICGDWNIAHKEIDLKNWKSNQKNSGFLPEERAWMTSLFDDHGWVDVYRHLYRETTGDAYTWWSNRGDYHVAIKGIASTAQSGSIYKEQRFSDHAPLIIKYA